MCNSLQEYCYPRVTKKTMGLMTCLSPSLEQLEPDITVAVCNKHTKIKVRNYKFSHLKAWIYSSLQWRAPSDDGAGVAAMIGASNAWSLSLSETCHVTRSTSSLLALRTFPISSGMYLYFFLTLTTLEFHSFVRWLYFLVTITSPVLVVAASKFTWKFQSIATNCFLALYTLYM